LPQILPFSFGEEQINLDDSVSVTCFVNKGNLPLEIYWTFTGADNVEEKLTTNDKVIISRTGIRMSILSIESVKRKMSGVYKCLAENIAGSVSHSTVLTIKGD
jgi:hypothetical protein